MEDYYKLLDIHYEASNDELNNACKNKIFHFKSLPFLTDNDKEQLKNIKKANVIFNNLEYKNTYDQYLLKKYKKEISTYEEPNKKKTLNLNYISDRIFDFIPNNNTQIMNIQHNELLRAKNVGLSSDNTPEFDKPLDFEESKEFMPYNYES